MSPSGKRFDYSKADEGLFLEGAFGAVLPTEDRTVIMLRKPERGTWKAELAAGSTAIVRIQQAPVLDQPKVKAKVSGKGSKRVLKYNIKPIAGQVVSFVETAEQGNKLLKTVQRGGRGKVRYTVAEAKGTQRTIEAQVTQDGLPRVTLDVARYSAPNPKLKRPKVRVRRKGTSAVVTWSKASIAVRYAASVSFTDGQEKLFTRGPKQRSVTVAGVGSRGGITARVTAYSQAGRNVTGTGKLKSKKPPKAKKKKKKKRKKGKRKRR